MKRLPPILLCLALGAPGGARAHHSGLYDEERVVAIEGTIAAVAWINPHIRVTLEASAADGGTETWAIEGTSVNALERWGIEPALFRVGQRLRVRGPVSRFGRNAMIGATAELQSGAEVVLWPNVAQRLGLVDTGVAGLFPPPPAPETVDGEGIFRVWTPRGRPSAAAPGSLPLTASAREVLAAYNPLTDDPALRCEPPGMPVMLDTPYPVEFVDRGDRILMRYEEWDAVRTIYMDPRNRPAVQAHSPRGTSFGRWEGDTLAIFTLYIDYPYFDDLGTPQSESATVLERYMPNADFTRLDWQVTVTDDATFTEPIERSGHYAFEPGEVIKPFDCTLLEP